MAEHRQPTEVSLDRLDWLGIGLFLLLSGWTAGVGWIARSGWVGQSVLLLSMATTYGVARVVGRRHAWVAAAAVAGACALLAAIRPSTLLSAPLGSPLGYSNAMGSLYFLAAASAGLMAFRLRSVAIRRLLLGLVAAFAAVPWLNDATTAAVLTVALGATMIAATRGRAGRLPLALMSCLVVAVLLLTVGLALRPPVPSPQDQLDRIVDASISLRRPALWRDALDMLAQHPLTGVGPSGFLANSPEARRDFDTPHAHHELLQAGAELGVVGLLLACALAGWACARLLTAPLDAGGLVGGIGVTGLLIHMQLDYVLRFPAVAMAGALLLGASVSQRADPTPDAEPDPAA